VGPQKRPGHGHLGYDFSPGVFDFSWDVFSHNVFLRSPLTSITVGAAPEACGPTPLPDRRDELDAPLHAPDFLLGVGRLVAQVGRLAMAQGADRGTCKLRQILS
jgi:hypothetical protein